MADLDPVVQQVLLEGDSEILRALGEIGAKGSEAFKALSEAAEGGAGGLQGFANALGAIEGAISATAAALLTFVEHQDEAIQRMAFLADAFGATAQQVSGLEAAFAQAGVSTETFERFAQRLTTTIAQQWPAITASVRTSATQQSEAQEQIVAATIRVHEAQSNLAIGMDEDSEKSAAANLRVSEAYHALQAAAQEAASARVKASQSVESASNSVEAAEQRLQTLQGNPPSAAQKQSLEIRQAELAVDQAQQAQVDALAAKQRQAAEEADKMAQKQLALAQAQTAAEKDAAGRTDAQRQRENSLAEAIDHRASAQERADKLALTSIPSISVALQGIVDKNEAAAKSVDLNQVSVRNLTNSILNMAAVQNNVAKPTGFQAFQELTKVLASSTDELISKDQQLAIVQQLVNRGMSTGGIAASELLNAMRNGPKFFDDYVSAAQKHISTTKEGVESAENFRKAMESFQQQLQLTTRDLAVLASPALISFLDALRESLTSSTGILHNFVSGLEAIGTGIGLLVEGFTKLGNFIDDALSEKHGTALKILLIALTTLVGLFAAPWVAIPILIAMIVTAMGGLSDITAKVKDAVLGMWASFKDSGVGQFISRIIDGMSKIVQVAASLLGFGKGAAANVGVDSVAANAPAAGAEGPTQAQATPAGFAGGGEIHGPGTQTSDSIFAKLSRGEFVVKAQAVQAYGAGLFHQLNNMQFPGFASGGLVPSPVRMGGGGGVPAASTLNLSIDGRSFNGLRGPKSTIDDLTSFAIARQTSTAGARPSWMK